MRWVLIGPVWPYRGGIAQHTALLARALAGAGHEVTTLTFRSLYPAWLFPGRTVIDPSEQPVRVPAERIIAPLWPIGWPAVARQVVERQRGARHGARHPRPLADDALQDGDERRRVDEPAVAAAERERGQPTGQPAGRVVRQDIVADQHDRRAPAAPAEEGAEADDERGEERHPPDEENGIRPCGAHAAGDGGDGAMPGEAALDATAPGDAAPDEVRPLPIGPAPTLLFFGLVRPYKGLDVLIDALAIAREAVPGVRLVVAGEFWQRADAFRAQADRLGLGDAVTLRDGYVQNEEVAPLFASADAVVLPYRAATSSGVLTLAIEHGVPMIVTDVGGLPEVVVDGDAGLVVPPGDARALAAAVVRLCEEPGLAARLRAGSVAARGRIGWAAYVAALVGLVGDAGVGDGAAGVGEAAAVDRAPAPGTAR